MKVKNPDGKEGTLIKGFTVISPEASGCELLRVHFAFDDYSLDAGARETLLKNVECLKKRGVSKIRIKIEGHCDERGSTEYNLALGEKRAESVRSFIAQQGIPLSQIEIQSFGEERPLAFGHDEESWAKNRRAESLLIQ